MSRVPISSALCCILFAVPAAAQSGYAPPGDTLHYRDETKTSVIISTPQGEMPVTGEQSGTVALVRYPGDSAHAWFESLSLSVSAPGGDQKPSAEELLRKPYRLSFDSRGRVRLVAAPEIPAAIEGIGDVRHEFDDFLLRLPEKPLRVGATWTDTLDRSDTVSGRTMHTNAITTYTVERDTVVSGTHAFVVHTAQRLTLGQDGPLPNQPMTAHAVLSGTVDGRTLFAPTPGVVLSRHREGHITGSVELGAPANMTMKEAIDYQNEIALMH